MKSILTITILLSTLMLFSQEEARFRIIKNNKVGYIDSCGKTVIEAEFAGGNDFSEGLASVRKDGLYGFIDSKGKYIIEPQYEYATSFQNGYAVVFKERKKKLINLKGDLINNDPNKDLSNHSENLVQSAFYGASTEYKDGKWGIVDSLGKYLIPAKFDTINDFDRNGFTNDLLKIVIRKKLTYINQKGDIIWQETKPDKNSIIPLNIDFMNRGYCYAYSNTEERNGWGISDNYPKKIGSKKFPKKQLSLFINQSDKATFEGNFKGCKLYLANTSDKKITLNASDSRLNILLQAMDSNGKWQYIEYAPSSWCGNSYHNLYLETGEYWDFTIPEYEGCVKTKIRAVLAYSEGKKETFVYSNTIVGSINPAQFFNKRHYTSTGLMDPYND